MFHRHDDRRRDQVHRIPRGSRAVLRRDHQGLQAEDLSKAEMKFAQKHIRILSGLYGILRPLDVMKPYRLEMGTKLETSEGKNLYELVESVLKMYRGKTQQIPPMFSALKVDGERLYKLARKGINFDIKEKKVK